MEPNSLSIGQFRKRGLRSVLCYQDNLIVTDSVEDVEQFKSPCRIDAITVLVCLGGEVDCRINLRQYHIGADMLLVNFPGDVIQVQRAEGLHAYAVLLSSDYLSELQIDFRERSDFYLNVRRNAVACIPHAGIAALEPYYHLLKSNILTQHAESPRVLCGLVQAFSYTIISMMRLFRREEETVAAGNPRSQQLFNKFMALLKLYHTSERSVTFYANRLCLTPNYLSGLIKEYSGRTATEWINDYVILEAKILLNHSDMSIQEVAYRLNFPTQSAFGKYFKQQTGVGPKRYRKDGLAEQDATADSVP